MKYILAAILLATTATVANARFDCGRVQAAYFGLPTSKFALALNWATLPRTTPHPGAVVVQRRAGKAIGGSAGGHVSRIESVIDHCRAIVTDEKGTYERNICKALVAVVDPRGHNEAAFSRF